jgi:hypothetical protein
LGEKEEGVDHPQQNDRESDHQEDAVEVVPPDLCLDADVGHGLLFKRYLVKYNTQILAFTVP